jgi:hypothetical protein
MIGPKPDSVNMYMHIIGIKFSKDETKELMILRMKLKQKSLSNEGFFVMNRGY